MASSAEEDPGRCRKTAVKHGIDEQAVHESATAEATAQIPGD
jgi:hypothetical protein